jgi:hypothetical protein
MDDQNRRRIMGELRRRGRELARAGRITEAGQKAKDWAALASVNELRKAPKWMILAYPRIASAVRFYDAGRRLQTLAREEEKAKKAAARAAKKAKKEAAK